MSGAGGDPAMRTYPDWATVIGAPGSTRFGGGTVDREHDLASGSAIGLTDAACFTQSNGRILIGQGADGALTFTSLPTRMYPIPTGERELGLGEGMYFRSDAPVHVGELAYGIAFDGAEDVTYLAVGGQHVTTRYADHFIPASRARLGDLEVSVLSLAPVALDAAGAPLAPAPLPGPAGALFVLHLRNIGDNPLSGRVVLRASDLLIADQEDTLPAVAGLKRPSIDLKQQSLILSRPEGSVGVHLHEGRWTSLEAPFRAERDWSLGPGEERSFETHVAMGATHGDVIPVIYELHRRTALEWFDRTGAFWRSRLGSLSVEADEPTDLAEVSRDIYIRSLFDNLNCVQVDTSGDVVAHLQGGPSEPHGFTWGIDVEPTATSLLTVAPEVAQAVMVWFASNSRAPRGPADHSTPILVAPLVIARQWLAATGDLEFFERRPDVLAALESIAADVMRIRHPVGLFPSRYASDGPVGRRYDYGTNIKVAYALQGLGWILRHLGRGAEADVLDAVAAETRAAIDRTMIVDGPFGRQVSGGTNLGEPPGTFHLPEDVLYYDGEDTSTMLAPIYGTWSDDEPAWLNLHRFARSLWCPNYDPEFDTVRWTPADVAVLDGTAFFSRVAGSRTLAEQWEAMEILRTVGTDDCTGSVFWWPHGLEYKRGMTRCSQGQGAWTWWYLERWLGIIVDAVDRVLTIDPRGPLRRVHWQGFAVGARRFDIAWTLDDGRLTASVTNHTGEAWQVRVGSPGGADPATLVKSMEPSERVTLEVPRRLDDKGPSEEWSSARIIDHEVRSLGDGSVLFKRFGSSVLWGHWDRDLRWRRGVLPFSLRFVIQNGTDQDWSNVQVELDVADGWTAQGRPARHWPRPDGLQPGPVRVDLGSLAAHSRGIAAFWTKGPTDYGVASAGRDRKTAFHTDRQPGPGLTIKTAEVDREVTYPFGATLSARTADGGLLTRRLEVPVRLVPDPSAPSAEAIP